MKKAPNIGGASVVLFIFGAVLGALYLAGLITGGDHATAFLESACALLLGAWVVGALHVVTSARKWRRREE